jgi:hypothetical protein
MPDRARGAAALLMLSPSDPFYRQLRQASCAAPGNRRRRQHEVRHGASSSITSSRARSGLALRATASPTAADDARSTPHGFSRWLIVWIVRRCQDPAGTGRRANMRGIWRSGTRSGTWRGLPPPRSRQVEGRDFARVERALGDRESGGSASRRASAPRLAQGAVRAGQGRRRRRAVPRRAGTQ